MIDPILAAQLMAAPPTQQNTLVTVYRSKGPPLPSCGYACHCPTVKACWWKPDAARLDRATRVGEWGTD